MSFLHRRRSFGSALLSSPSEDALPPPPMPFPPAVENIHGNSSQPHLMSLISKGRKISPGTTLIRRVSSLLGKKPRRQPAFTPLDVQAPPESRWKPINSDDGSESDVSFDDIRRPSGLGRSVSISSQRSLPPSPFTAIDEESPFHNATKAAHERFRALSSPNPTRFTGTTLANPMPSSISLAHRNKDRPPPPMPHEVLVTILSFTPRKIIASHARTSSDWCTAARSVLYETIDLRTLRPKQAELLVTLLAYRHDLTDLVRTFECYEWPVFFPPQIHTAGVLSPSPSFSPGLTAVFTIAFQNMHLITSLVLPSFDHTFLRHHSAFGLKKLTILSTTMTTNETTQLFAWLDGQVNITHLAFPNLVDPNAALTSPDSSLTIPKTSQSPRNTLTDSSNTYDLSTPHLTPSSSPVASFALLTPTVPASPFNSLNLLPALTTLVATPSIVSSLVAARPTAIPRPLEHITLSISNTLFTGLRPTTLLSPLYGVSTLILKFSPAVDKRTIGKVLSAGSVLTAASSSDDSTTDSIDSSSSTQKPWLRNLELQISEQPGADLALYKIISSSISRYHGLVALRCCFAPKSPTPNEILTDRESAQITAWTKHCPSLQSVDLLSGARWKQAEDSGDLSR